MMNRFSLGLLLSFIGAILSLFEFTLVFLSSVFVVNIIIQYVIAWYAVATGLALVLLFGAIIAYRGRKTLGGRILVITTVSSITVNVIIFAAVGLVAPIFYYQPLVVDRWFLLSMVGGILILKAKTE